MCNEKALFCISLQHTANNNNALKVLSSFWIDTNQMGKTFMPYHFVVREYNGGPEYQILKISHILKARMITF